MMGVYNDNFGHSRQRQHLKESANSMNSYGRLDNDGIYKQSPQRELVQSESKSNLARRLKDNAVLLRAKENSLRRQQEREQMRYLPQETFKVILPTPAKHQLQMMPPEAC